MTSPLNTTFLRQLVSLAQEKQQDIQSLLQSASSNEEASQRFKYWLLHGSFSERGDFIHQFLRQELANLPADILGREIGIACGRLFGNAPPRAAHPGEEENWRGNTACAFLVRLLAESNTPWGGLAYSDDLERKGHRTASWRRIESLEFGVDYDVAALKNTTLEQVANFGDYINIVEIGGESASRERAHRELAGFLASHCSYHLAHQVLFRIIQAGGMDYLSPNVFPLDEAERDRQLATLAALCDGRASQRLGVPSHWYPCLPNHRAFAGVIAQVAGVEEGLRCMRALSQYGSLANLSPAHFSLPLGGEEGEWDWHIQRGEEA